MEPSIPSFSLFHFLLALVVLFIFSPLHHHHGNWPAKTSLASYVFGNHGILWVRATENRQKCSEPNMQLCPTDTRPNLLYPPLNPACPDARAHCLPFRLTDEQSTSLMLDQHSLAWLWKFGHIQTLTNDAITACRSSAATQIATGTPQMQYCEGVISFVHVIPAIPQAFIVRLTWQQVSFVFWPNSSVLATGLIGQITAFVTRSQ